jgi:hypothetical protein
MNSNVAEGFTNHLTLAGMDANPHLDLETLQHLRLLDRNGLRELARRKSRENRRLWY